MTVWRVFKALEVSYASQETSIENSRVAGVGGQDGQAKGASWSFWGHRCSRVWWKSLGLRIRGALLIGGTLDKSC
jgi:hypothetical protein